MKIKSFIFLCFVELHIVFSNVNETDIEKLKAHIPPGLIPEELMNSTFSLEDARKILREKCTKVSQNNKTYDEIEETVQDLFSCLNSLFNMTSIQEEIKLRQPNGELDEVFNKYCSKRPDTLKCIETTGNKIELCLTEDEIEHKKTVMKMIRQLFDFVCHKNGDQIALFIAEKGPECIKEKKDNIAQCFGKIIHEYTPTKDISSIEDLPQFVFGPKQCEDIKVLQNCVVIALETCENITPANLFGAMFKNLANQTTCKISSERQTSSSNIISMPIFGTIFTILIGYVLIY